MKFLAAWLSPFSWRNRATTARRLAAFSRAEQNSQLLLNSAARGTTDVRRKALYLRHALDEGRHARLFRKRALELATEAEQGKLNFVADADDLFEKLGERRFVAFVCLGERRGRAQFESYVEHFRRQGQRRLGRTFAVIVKDERRHESYTWQLLLEWCGGDSRKVHWLLFRARLWEMRRDALHFGQRTARVLYVACACLLYASILPWAWLFRRGAETAVGLRPVTRALDQSSMP